MNIIYCFQSIKMTQIRERFAINFNYRTLSVQIDAASLVQNKSCVANKTQSINYFYSLSLQRD